MNREELISELMSLPKQEVCNIMEYLMEKGKIDIANVLCLYSQSLNEKIEEQRQIIKEADNCIFNSLFYDKEDKVDSINVITQKLKWLNEYGDHNTDYINKEFRYEHKRGD